MGTCLPAYVGHLDEHGPGCVRGGDGEAPFSQKHRRIVVCDISGYGTSGEWQSRKAYDLLVQAEAGLIGVTGTAEHPAKAGIAVADIAAAMYAFSGILGALFERERTGEGAVIEISLLDSLAEWMGYPFYYNRYGGTPPTRTGASHATIAPYGAFTTGDGKTLLLAVQNEQEWGALCTRVLRRPELARDPRLQTNSLRVANRALTDRAVGEAIGKLTLPEVVELCEAARIAYGQMNEVGTLEQHPQLRARRRWTEIDSPVGPIASMLPPIVVRGGPPTMGEIPALGQHVEPVLLELGYTDDEIRALRQDGIV